jgi:hypothetical protein
MHGEVNAAKEQAATWNQKGGYHQDFFSDF